MSEPQRTFEFYVVLEHVSLIGGLMVAAALGHRAPWGDSATTRSVPK
jgi:transmembrane protein